MRIERLKIKNFMIIKEFEEDFTNNYLTIVSGSNGQGKSSLLEAIALCLIERRLGDSYRDYITINKRRAYIDLTIKLNNNKLVTIKVIIHAKKTLSPLEREIIYDGKIYKNKECTHLLRALFNPSIYSLVVFSMQDDVSIVKLRPAERRELLRKIFDFDFNYQIDKVQKQIDQDENMISTLNSKIDLLKNKKYITQPLNEEKDLLTVEKDLEILLKSRKDVSRDLYNIEKNLIQLSHDKSMKAQLDTQLKKENKAINKKIDLQLEADEALKSLRTNYDLLEKDIESIKNKSEVTKAKLNYISNYFKTIKEQIKEVSKQLKIRRMKENLLNEKIEAFKKGICDRCEQETNVNKVPELENEMESLLLQMVILEKEILTKGSTYKELESDIYKSEKELSQYENQSYENALNKNNCSEKIDKIKKEILEYKRDLPLLRKEVDELNKKISKLEKTINSNKELLKKDEYATNLRNILSDLDSEIEVNNNIVQENNVNVKTNFAIKNHNREILTQKENDVKDIVNLYKKIEQSAINNETNKTLKKLIADLINFAIIKACYELENLINNFIETVKEDVRVKLFQSKSGVEFFYSKDHEKTWINVKLASGFETQLLSIAFKIAIANLYNIDVLILDEIDSSATTENSERVFKTLSQISGFAQIFVVTHKQFVKDTLIENIDNCIVYYVDKGEFHRTFSSS